MDRNPSGEKIEEAIDPLIAFTLESLQKRLDSTVASHGSRNLFQIYAHAATAIVERAERIVEPFKALTDDLEEMQMSISNNSRPLNISEHKKRVQEMITDKYFSSNGMLSDRQH